MRVLDAVADNDERHLTALLGDAENIVERDVLLCRRLCDNALMVAGRAHAVQLAPVAGDDRNAMPARFCRHITEDGVASLDQRAVILNRRTASVFFICHKFLRSKMRNNFAYPQILSVSFIIHTSRLFFNVRHENYTNIAAKVLP